MSSGRSCWRAEEGGREGEDPPTPPLAMSDLIPLAAARAGLEMQDSPVPTSLIDQPSCPEPESLLTLSHRKTYSFWVS